MIPDNYDMWEAHERRAEARIAELPVCERCGKPIQGDYLYLINDEFICEKCLNREFRWNVEDFI